MDEVVRDEPPVETQESVLWHCGRRMAVTDSRMEGQVRVRYWRCGVCQVTSKSTDWVPLGRAEMRRRADRRR